MLSLRYVMNVISYIKVSKLSREEVLKLQENKWRKLVRYVHKHSPYYSRIMKERGLDPRTARPEDFPILTKAIIQEHYNEIVTDPAIRLEDVHAHVEKGQPENLYLNRYYVLKTSGSTGKPGYFLSSEDEVLKGVSPTVARSHVGVRRRNKRVCMIGFPRSFAGSSQTMSFCNKFWLARMLIHYKAISIEQPIDEVIREVNEFQPHIVSGYAKLLLLLADAQRSGKLNICPDSLDSGGEQLLETDRRYLKETFGCAVNNHYGSTEGYAMGICRDGEDSFELFEDRLIFDIREDETHITNLDAYVMPLIRYQMRDVLMPRPIEEAQPFRRVECLIGRSDEIPYFTTEQNGRVTVHPLAFDPLMPIGVKSFFMSSPKPNEVVFHIFIDDKHSERTGEIMSTVRETLKAFFSEKGLSNINVQAVIESEYQVNPKTGKTQFWRQSVLQ